MSPYHHQMKVTDAMKPTKRTEKQGVSFVSSRFTEQFKYKLTKTDIFLKLTNHHDSSKCLAFFSRVSIFMIDFLYGH